MGEKLEQTEYPYHLKAVYTPLKEALADNSKRVRIGPTYQFVAQLPPYGPGGISYIPLFVLPYVPPNPQAHIANNFFVFALQGGQIVSHRISELSHNPSYVTVDDKGFFTNDTNKYEGLLLELVHYHILDTLSKIYGKQIYYRYDAKNYRAFAENLDFEDEQKIFNPFDRRALLKAPYSVTLDEAESVLLSTYTSQVDSKIIVRAREKSTVKRTDVNELRKLKVAYLKNGIMPALKKTAGIKD